MSIKIPTPLKADPALYQFLLEILRRAVDGTVVPLFVDYSNNRIIIGGVSASASPATIEVAQGDIKVVSAGSGIILSNRGGTQYYRLVVENDGALSVDPL